MGTLATEVGRMNTGLRGLKSRLAEVLEYLQLVGSGKLPVNHDIIYDLQVCSIRSSLSDAAQIVLDLLCAASVGHILL